MTQTKTTKRKSTQWTRLLRKAEIDLAKELKQVTSYQLSYDSNAYILSVAVCYSVLNKVYEKSGNIHVKRLRDELSRANRAIKTLDNMIMQSQKPMKEYSYNSRTGIATAKISKKQHDFEHDAITSAIDSGDITNDAMDLIHVAYIKMLELTKNLFKSGKIELERGYLEKIVTVKIPNRKTLPMGGVYELKDYKTSIIKATFKAVRSYIYSQKKYTNNNNQTHVISDLEKTDTITGETYNVAYTVPTRSIFDDEKDYKKFDGLTFKRVCKDLKLTPIQKSVIELRAYGYGDKAAARALGGKRGSIQKARRNVAAKFQNSKIDFYKEISERQEREQEQAKAQAERLKKHDEEIEREKKEFKEFIENFRKNLKQ